MATSKLKVYGWIGVRSACEPSANGSQQTREIVAAPSLAQVMRLTGLSRSYLTNYGCETGNEEELLVALGKPGTIFWQPLRGGAWQESKQAG